MKQLLIFLPFFLLEACSKENLCPEAKLTCTHKIYYSFVACPSPQNPDQLIFSNCLYYIEKYQVSECDTSVWLAKANAFNENRKSDSKSTEWTAFAREYPNKCECK